MFGRAAARLAFGSQFLLWGWRAWRPYPARSWYDQPVALPIGGVDHPQPLAPFLHRQLPSILPAGRAEGSGGETDRVAMADGPAHGWIARQLEAIDRQLGRMVQGDVRGEANLGGRDRQHATLTLLVGAETTDDMVNVMGGSNPADQPLIRDVDGPRAEKLRVVVEAPDQLGVLMTQAARGHPGQVIEVRMLGLVPLIHHLRSAGQGPEAGNALLHLGGIQEALRQVADLVEGAATAAYGDDVAQLAQGLQ